MEVENEKIYKRILSLGLAVGVIFSLQEGVHICAQENIQATEGIFADYNDGNKEKTDTEDQITGAEAEENTERTTEETENRKNTERATRETETGKNTEQTTEETENGKTRSRQLRQRPGKSWMMTIQKKRKKVSGWCMMGQKSRRNRTSRNWMKDFIRTEV